MHMPLRLATDSGKVPEWAVRLRAARVMTGLSQTAFAKKIGVSQQRYGLWENGGTEPNVETWVRLSDELNVSLDFLLKGRTGQTAQASDKL